MSNYKNALNKISVTKEMEEKIMKKINENNDQFENNKVVRRNKWMVPAGVAACCVLTLGLTFALPNMKKENNGKQVEIANPIKETSDITELKTMLPFTLKVPTNMPEGYTVRNASAIAGSLAQITYVNGTDEINYRMAEGCDDISGDYNIYDTVKEITVEDIKVTLKGSADMYQIAIYNDGAYSYAIHSTCGLSEVMIKSIIENIN